MGIELLFLVTITLAFCAGVGVGYFVLGPKYDYDEHEETLANYDKEYEELANYYDEEYAKMVTDAMERRSRLLDWKEEHDKNLYYTSFEYEEAQLNLAESEAEYDA